MFQNSNIEGMCNLFSTIHHNYQAFEIVNYMYNTNLNQIYAYFKNIILVLDQIKFWLPFQLFSRLFQMYHGIICFWWWKAGRTHAEQKLPTFVSDGHCC
jgi:hypothetical protein